MRAYEPCMPAGAPSRLLFGTPWNSTCQGMRCQWGRQQNFHSGFTGGNSSSTVLYLAVWHPVHCCKSILLSDNPCRAVHLRAM